MASRLPVGVSLNETIQFVVKRWATIIRLGWAPMVLALLIFLSAIFSVIDRSSLGDGATVEASWSGLSSFFRYPLLVTIIALLAAIGLATLMVSGFMASIYRLVALGEEDPNWINVRFDGPAIRVFAAYVILNVINISVYLFFFLVATIVMGVTVGDVFEALGVAFRLAAEAAANGGEPASLAGADAIAPVGAIGFAIMLSAIPLIYLNVRLAPFIAGSAAENRLWLVGAFYATAGNFWPIFLFNLLLFLVLMAVAFIVQIITGFVDLLSQLPPGGVFSVIAFVSGMASFVVSILYQFASLGLQLSGQAIIYRRLKTGE